MLMKEAFKKVTYLSLSFLFLPAAVFALGFGDITVYSKLNEPLKVHINLENSKSMKIDEIRVKNASLNIYRRANLPKPDTFNAVRFNIRKEADSSLLVELTSKRPVREPFITFIAEMKWPKGHLTREYTFLLDPPEFIQKHSRPTSYQKPPSVKKATTITQASGANKKAASFRKSQPEKQKVDHNAIIAAHVNDNSYGPTKRADTLWAIAKRVRPSNDVTTYQTMQALFVLNPKAFINGNINLLRQGKTLTIPSTSEILKINGKAPIEKASKSTKSTSYKASSRKRSPSRVIERESDKKEYETDESPEFKADKIPEVHNEARLKIIPSTEELINKPVTSKKDLLLINKALKTSISTIKVLQNENQTLASKVEQLTAKINNLDSHNQKLNDKIIEITSLLKNKPINSDKQAEDKDAIDKKALPAPVHSAVLPESDSVSLSLDSQLAHQKVKPRSFIRELLTSPVITFALAIFTIIILLLTLLTIRKQNDKRKLKKQNSSTAFSDIKKNKSPDDEASFVKQYQNRSTEPEPVPEQTSEKTAEKNEKDMDFFEYFEKKISAPDGVDQTEKSKFKAKPTESNTVNEPEDTKEINVALNISNEEIQNYEKSISHSYENSKKKPSKEDTLSEIDTYIAYGNYEKAEKLLMESIKKSPSDNSLHLKLFECYRLNNQRDEFMKHVERIINLLNSDIVFRHRIENTFRRTWKENLNINKLT